MNKIIYVKTAKRKSLKNEPLITSPTP